MSPSNRWIVWRFNRHSEASGRPSHTETQRMHRAVLAEGLGSMLLTAAVIGSGIMAQRLTGDGAVALLANTLATVAALAVLIAMFAPLSGAHFNPAVSLISFLRGRLSFAAATTYIG